MRFIFGFIVFIVAIGVIGTMTCPGKEKHVEKLSSVAVEAMVDETEEWGVAGKLAEGALNEASDNGLVEKAVNEFLTVEDYGAFSLGKVSYRGEEYVVSLGLFGVVFTMTSDMMGDKMEDFLERELGIY